MTFRARVLSFLVDHKLQWLAVLYWRLKGDPEDHLRHATAKERFAKIYEENVWGGAANAESRSGTGSSIDGTQSLRSRLPAALDALGARSLVDIGCGDFNWMKLTPLTQKYIGLDIVPSVIQANKSAFESETVVFHESDSTVDPLPAADAALCREVLFHLSFEDGEKLIANVCRSSAAYFLCTTDPTFKYNANIPTGAWRDLNLEIAPYNFPEPLERIADPQPDNPHRELGVWRVDDLRERRRPRVAGKALAS